MTIKQKINLLLIFVLPILQSCTPSEEELWGLGSFVFLVFIIIVLLNTFIPKLQERLWMKNIISKLEFIGIKIFFILIVLSISLFIVGLISIINNENRTSFDLLLFIGVISLYVSINFRKWALEKNKYQKRNYVRFIGIGVSFILILLYIMQGAENLTF